MYILLRMIFLILIYSSFIMCDVVKELYDITVSSVNNFPHNIDEDFTINTRHPEIKSHHLYAVFILHVNCPSTTESQKLFIYPGFTAKLDHRLKETLFHIMNFKTRPFNTEIVLRFYREARNCLFMVEYSAVGAENIHIKMPTDLMLVYKTKIILFRPAKLQLTILAEDGHQGGLSIGKRGDIICKAKDGFPFYSPVLSFEKEIATLKPPSTVEDTVSVRVMAALKDHGTLVTCTSGNTVTSTRIRVFHHALSVDIIPNNQQWFRQGSKLKCKSVGGGYPTPMVRWTIIGVNDTTREYFSISSLSQAISIIRISSSTPNDTRWTLNCSSVNMIPPLDRGGPWRVVNITIGENVSKSIMMANYVWIVVVTSIIVLVVIIIGIVCISSHCRRWAHSRSFAAHRSEPRAPPASPEVSLMEKKYSMVPTTDIVDDKPCSGSMKDLDNFV